MLSGDCPTIVAPVDIEEEVEDELIPSAEAPTPSAPTGAVPVVTDTDQIHGNKDAKVTIIEYSDFECSFCSRFHGTVQQATDEFGDDVRWVYRHFPLSFHANAETAAIAAECAGAQGKFWEFADTLFENQGSFSDAFYKKTASGLGLNASTFESCLSDENILAKVRSDSQGGQTAGVTGTPGSFIIDEDGNATVIKGAQPYSSLQAAIQAAL
jgi:protein-disulfide isomerase